MKVTLWMTITVNGIIATSDYSEDFSSNKNWEEFVKSVDRCGCLIWGRKTYEKVQTWNPEYLETVRNYTKIILSHNPDLDVNIIDGFVKAGSPEDALEILRNKGFREVILTGGSKNNASFAKLGLIDEVILDVEPAILGSGIPLIDPFEAEIRLQLIETKIIDKNIVQLHYKVLN